MPQFITDCPRCGVKNTTFDLMTFVYLRGSEPGAGEVFSVCRACHRSTVFIIAPRNISLEGAFSDRYEFNKAVLNEHLTLIGRVSLIDMITTAPPEHIPEDINKAFLEGSACLSAECPNASVAMYRLCLDLATKSLLPQGDVPGLSEHVRRNLSPRLKWLFENKRLDDALEDLSHCIKDNGNDGAHDGTVGDKDAQDVQEFTFELLEKLYTQPKKIELARERRNDRHKTPK